MVKQLFAAVALTFLLAGPAVAAQKCGKRAELLANLGKKYGEHPKAMGLINKHSILEIFVSPETGTWTIMRSGPAGTSCLIAVGKWWEDQPPAPKGKEGA